MQITDKSLTGTHLQGYARTTYGTLVEKLGMPTRFNPTGETTVEWTLEDTDGNIVRVYDKEQKRTPKGEYDWHVSGHSPKVRKSLTDYTGIPVEDWRTYYD